MINETNLTNSRRKIRIPILCWEANEEKRLERGKEIISKELNEDSLGFISPHIYPIDTILLADLYFPGRSKPISCKLKVTGVEAVINKDEPINTSLALVYIYDWIIAHGWNGSTENWLDYVLNFSTNGFKRTFNLQEVLKAVKSEIYFSAPCLMVREDIANDLLNNK